MSLKCAFTGHGDLQNFDKEKLTAEIKAVIERGVTEFYCGMARGFDLLAAETVINFKKEYNIKLIACVPCPGQDRFFSVNDRARYNEALENCDEVKVLAPHYFNGCMQKRNRFLVDSADLILCYLTKNEGGTYYTVKYAKAAGKEIINLA